MANEWMSYEGLLGCGCGGVRFKVDTRSIKSRSFISSENWAAVLTLKPPEQRPGNAPINKSRGIFIKYFFFFLKSIWKANLRQNRSEPDRKIKQGEGRSAGGGWPSRVWQDYLSRLIPGKLTSLRDHELRDVSPTADAGLLKYHTVSYKLVPAKLIAHRRHWPRHGAAIFPRNAHQVGLYIWREPETKSRRQMMTYDNAEQWKKPSTDDDVW